MTKISLWVIRTIIKIMSKQNQKHNLPDYKTSDAATRGQKTRAAQMTGTKISLWVTQTIIKIMPQIKKRKSNPPNQTKQQQQQQQKKKKKKKENF